jgi:[histone H3]-lysine79 N-trimethyltransferase
VKFKYRASQSSLILHPNTHSRVTRIVTASLTTRYALQSLHHKVSLPASPKTYSLCKVPDSLTSSKEGFAWCIMLLNKTAKKPTVRRETVLVPKTAKPASKSTPRPQQKSKPPPPQERFQLGKRDSSKSSPAPSKKPQAAIDRVVSATRTLKRKSTTPERTSWADESDDDSTDALGASDSDAVSRKRIKSSVSSVDSGPSRTLIREAVFKEQVEGLDFLQGADATSGEQKDKFKNPWGQEDFATVELQYPSNTRREKFELKWPKNEKDDYKPMEDIIETVKEICALYLPHELSEKYGGRERYESQQKTSSFAWRFSRAWSHQNIPEFISVVEDFNDLMKKLVDDGTIRREISSKRQLPLETVRRILDQIYARTVSPKVETLRAYQNGGDNVYGELLPRFCSDIFRQVGLNESHVFVDLGSGVGNVVLQAALEVGCESWGIEMMKNPCDLAELQAKEFPARAALWGLTAGKANLIRGNFTENTEISAVLQRADVVLVNNQAFTPQLNDVLKNMFLDLKEGAKVASLKPFVSDKIKARNAWSAENTLVQKKYEYFSGSVSWTNQMGNWYIATKDSRPLQAFQQREKRRS